MAKFNYSNMYYFHYNPKYKEILPEYDKTPLVLFLNVGNTHSLGINFHWIPLRFRPKLISYINKMSVKIINKKYLSRITYELLKNHPVLKTFGMQAIRLYINKRISNISTIPPEKINQFLLLRPKYISHKIRLAKKHKKR